jgi:hypothetical protein
MGSSAGTSHLLGSSALELEATTSTACTDSREDDLSSLTGSLFIPRNLRSLIDREVPTNPEKIPALLFLPSADATRIFLSQQRIVAKKEEAVTHQPVAQREPRISWTRAFLPAWLKDTPRWSQVLFGASMLLVSVAFCLLVFTVISHLKLSKAKEARAHSDPARSDSEARFLRVSHTAPPLLEQPRPLQTL